jgi:hypothetical protein
MVRSKVLSRIGILPAQDEFDQRISELAQLRAQRSNSEYLRGKILDCFAALAMTENMAKAACPNPLPRLVEQRAVNARKAHIPVPIRIDSSGIRYKT